MRSHHGISRYWPCRPETIAVPTKNLHHGDTENTETAHMTTTAPLDSAYGELGAGNEHDDE
jgi:hypothetical protein